MRMQALPSVNYVYADRAGTVAYFYNALLPLRAEGFDWSGTLPGDRGDLVWSRVLPFDAVPQVVNPPAGFVVNANHTPFAATAGAGNPAPADFPAALGIETLMTNRGLRALELLGADASIDAEELRRIKFDKRYSEHSPARRIRDEILAAEPPDDPLLREARRVLAGWDLGTDAQSAPRGCWPGATGASMSSGAA
jgi:penicillin amidase/acyl-homoserine-lactone acylase